nr:MAG TPA: hypothetical protein [Caudoviricetes sp.]
MSTALSTTRLTGWQFDEGSISDPGRLRHRSSN